MRFARGDEEIIVRVKAHASSQRAGGAGAHFPAQPLRSQRAADADCQDYRTLRFFLIKHEDGQRLVSVTADLDLDEMELPDLLEQLDQKIMPQIMADYGVRYYLFGSCRRATTQFTGT